MGRPKNITYEITEEDVGRSAVEVFSPYWPENGWAGEITTKNVGMRVHCIPSVFVDPAIFETPRRRYE